MWVRLLIIILTAAHSVIAIRVPVDNTEIEATELVPIETLNDDLKKPIYYLPDDGKGDSFLIPPHQLEEIEVSAPLATPATYLLPPAPGKHIDYYYRPEQPEQTDWYPIASNQKKQSEDTQSQVDDESVTLPDTKYRNGKELQESQIPQINLVPPTANAQNDYIILAPSAELELPNENVDIDEPTNIPQIPREAFTKIRPHNIHPKILPVPYLMPPKNLPPKYYPTKLYPKKFVNEFKPIPIPINQYADEHVDKVPIARPLRPFHPTVNVDGQYEIPEDKQVYSYEKAENQRKLQATEDIEQPHVASPSKDVSSEPEASESNFGHPSRNTYPAPLKQSPPVSPSKYASASGERTEFRMHGMKGPHSYQFGYDTGKGKNRQFRYEERDNDGHVKGHYGYMDKHGKLRVVNYDADPEHGFRAETPVEE